MSETAVLSSKVTNSEDPVVKGVAEEDKSVVLTHFVGERLSLGMVQETLKLSPAESEGWVPFIKAEPDFLYCPLSGQKLGQGGVAVLAWYSDEGGPFELRLVKYGQSIPAKFQNVEIFDLANPGCKREVWKERLLQCMATASS